MKTSISPTQVTGLSIALGLVAAGMFFLADYQFLIIGVFFLNISLVLDKVDGQLARLKNQTSALGGWIDCVGDILTMGLYFLSLSLGAYFQNQNSGFLIAGLFCQFHLLMAFYIITAKAKMDGQGGKKEVSLKNSYFGLINSLHVFLSVGCLLNQIYGLLVVFSFVGVMTWAPTITRIYFSHPKS